MYSTFAALSGLAFFLGLRTTGFAIVELPFRGARTACEDDPGWSVRMDQKTRWIRKKRRAATQNGGARFQPPPPRPQAPPPPPPPPRGAGAPRGATPGA